MSEVNVSDELLSRAHESRRDIPREPVSVFAARLIIGGLLLVTAVFKVISTTESAAVAVAYHIPPLLTATVVQVELAIASLLLTGVWSKQTLRGAAAMFALFGAFSLYRGSAGYESCGCFGSLELNPWGTAALDGTLFMLAAWGASSSSPKYVHEPKRLYSAGAAYAVAGLLAAVGMIIQAPSSSFDSNGLVILRPETWIGKPFPLAEHLMPKITFEGGHWTVLLYHYDCPRCREAVPEYERLALARKDRQIVLIETPPYGFDQSTEGAAIHVRLSDAREWFVQTPVEVCVDDGIVVSASFDVPSVAEEPPQFSANAVFAN